MNAPCRFDTILDEDYEAQDWEEFEAKQAYLEEQAEIQNDLDFFESRGY